jgi:hypothetical protein
LPLPAQASTTTLRAGSSACRIRLEEFVTDDRSAVSLRHIVAILHEARTVGQCGKGNGPVARRRQPCRAGYQRSTRLPTAQRRRDTTPSPREYPE